MDAGGVEVGRPNLDLEVGDPAGYRRTRRLVGPTPSRVARVGQQADGGVREELLWDPRDEIGGHVRHDVAVVIHVAVIEIQLARRLRGGVGAELREEPVEGVAVVGIVVGAGHQEAVGERGIPAVSHGGRGLGSDQTGPGWCRSGWDCPRRPKGSSVSRAMGWGLALPEGGQVVPIITGPAV